MYIRLDQPAALGRQCCTGLLHGIFNSRLLHELELRSPLPKTWMESPCLFSRVAPFWAIGSSISRPFVNWMLRGPKRLSRCDPRHVVRMSSQVHHLQFGLRLPKILATVVDAGPSHHWFLWSSTTQSRGLPRVQQGSQ
jgi:hypothetical protein